MKARILISQREPVWDALRGDARFADITRKVRSVRVRMAPHGPGDIRER